MCVNVSLNAFSVFLLPRDLFKLSSLGHQNYVEFTVNLPDKPKSFIEEPGDFFSKRAHANIYILAAVRCNLGMKENKT